MILLDRIKTKGSGELVGYDTIFFEPIFYLVDVHTTFMSAGLSVDEIKRLFLDYRKGEIETVNKVLDKLHVVGTKKMRLLIRLTFYTNLGYLHPAHKQLSLTKVFKAIKSRCIHLRFLEKGEQRLIWGDNNYIKRRMPLGVERYLMKRILYYAIENRLILENGYEFDDLYNYARLYYWIKENKKK